MAGVKKPEMGNSAELKRLKDEVSQRDLIIQKLSQELQDKTKEVTASKSENGKLNTSLMGAQARIKTLELAVNRQKQGDEGVQDGYVTIASCPLPNGTKPLRVEVGGILAPRVMDEDGIVSEDVTIPVAVALLSEGSGFARYLTGPVNSIQGTVRKGMYNVQATFHRFKKVKTPTGYTFVRSLVEESNPKE